MGVLGPPYWPETEPMETIEAPSLRLGINDCIKKNGPLRFVSNISSQSSTSTLSKSVGYWFQH